MHWQISIVLVISPSYKTKHIIREGLNKLQKSYSRHSGVGQNLVKTIVYWILVFTSMTVKLLYQSFLRYLK